MYIQFPAAVVFLVLDFIGVLFAVNCIVSMTEGTITAQREKGCPLQGQRCLLPISLKP